MIVLRGILQCCTVFSAAVLLFCWSDQGLTDAVIDRTGDCACFPLERSLDAMDILGYTVACLLLTSSVLHVVKYIALACSRSSQLHP